MKDLSQIRQDLAKLRDSVVTASTIKAQMEEQIKDEVTKICNLLPDSDDRISVSKESVETAANALKDNISSETMTAFKEALDAFCGAVDEQNAKDIEEIEALISEWKAQIAGENND